METAKYGITDWEAAVHLPNRPGTSATVSSGTELTQFKNQPHPQLQAEGRASPKPVWSREPILSTNFNVNWKMANATIASSFVGNYIGDQRAVPLLIHDPEDEERIYQDSGRILYETWMVEIPPILWCHRSEGSRGMQDKPKL